jgi:cysteine-rich repeat protein
MDSAETCDDGNRINGDGCDRYCRVETQEGSSLLATQYSQLFPRNFQQFPSQLSLFPRNFQQIPSQLPLAQLQPLIQSQSTTAETGPAAVAVVASGMAAGLGWIRRKRK